MRTMIPKRYPPVSRAMTGESMGEVGTINVVEHIITKNMWEYYILDDPENVSPEGYATALVMGHETEIGGVCLTEIEPFIASRTTQLNDIFPPVGWSWVESN